MTVRQLAWFACAVVIGGLAGCVCDSSGRGADGDCDTMQPVAIHYLEIVTPEVDATCAALAAVHGVEFGGPVVELGNARTAMLTGGGRIGVRAPMRETEAPVVRPYVRVRDIAAAARAAESAGGQIALPPTEIPGQGTIVIYIMGGIEHGLWQPIEAGGE